MNINTVQSWNLGPVVQKKFVMTVELQWLEHLKNNESMFVIGIIRANECKS